MIDGKDRTAVFNAEYRLLDMIYVGLRLWSLTKKLGNECRNRSHVICGRVLLALAHVLDSSHLTFEIILPERVVGRTVATDVVIDNELAHYACDSFVRFGVPPAHSNTCNNFRHEPRLELVYNAA